MARRHRFGPRLPRDCGLVLDRNQNAGDQHTDEIGACNLASLKKALDALDEKREQSPPTAKILEFWLVFTETGDLEHECLLVLVALYLGEQQVEIQSDDDDNERKTDPALAVVLRCDEDCDKERYKGEQIKHNPCTDLRNLHTSYKDSGPALILIIPKKPLE